ncbi:MAG: uL15 family ribosomal protein, partial [Eubacteriales bacterium]|nr:uL15 family ribosomal protein [Eubacteriales bacterium]
MTKKKVPVSRIFCLILAVLFFLAGIYLLLAAIAGNGTPVAKISDFLLEKGILRTFGYSATVLTVAGCVALALSLLSLFLSHHPVLLSLLLATLSVGLGVYGFFYLKHFSPRLFVILLADGVIIFLCALLIPKEEPLQLRKKSAPAQTGSPETAEPAMAETEAAVEVSAAIEAAAGEAAEEAAMAAEPLTEPAVAEPVSEMTAEVSADADHGRVRVGEKEIEVSYRKSFTARLLLSEDPVKDYYTRIHNYILSYTGKNRVSWFYDSYNSGRTQLVKLAIRGKTLCAYFALDFAEYENTKYHVQEAATKRYEKVPVMLRVRSERGVKYAKELVDAVMAKYGVAQNEKKTGTAAVADYPRDTLMNLIKRGLVKVLSEDGAELSGEDITLVPVAFALRRDGAPAVDEEGVAFAEDGAEDGESAAPAAATAKEPAITTAEEPEPEAAEETERGHITIGGRVVEVAYRKSFMAKLLLSEEDTKDYYARIHNHILSYTGKNRVSWFYDSYNSGRTQLVKLAIRGKTLCAYFALDFAEYENTKYHVQEAATKRYEKVPVMLRVRSERGVKYAKELVDAVMAKYGVTQNEKKTGTATAADYPVDTLQNLISRQLVKVLATDGDDLTGEDVTLVPVAFTVRHSVTVHEAKNLLSDEDALTLVAPAAPEETAETEKELPYHGGRKFPVNIDTLSAHFENGDTVTPAALRRMGLIPKKAAGVKILARGTLNKSLTVLAHDFSADAVKMIALTGG